MFQFLYEVMQKWWSGHFYNSNEKFISQTISNFKNCKFFPILYRLFCQKNETLSMQICLSLTHM